MRVFARLSLILLIFGLAAGPAFAAPIAVDASLSAPAGHSSPGLFGKAAQLFTAAGVIFGITIRKDTGTLAAKFVTRAGAAQGDYKDGVAAAGPAWQQNTGAAEGNYEQGVQSAIANKAFAKGVAKAGPTKYVNNATNLGAGRYGPGVANAKDAWSKGVQPYLDTLKSLNLPPKGPRRSPQNMQRAAAVASALAAAKVGQ